MKLETCEFPDSLLYDAEASTWAKEEGTGYVVGLTPVLAWLSGGFTSISTKEAGTAVSAGKGVASIEGPRHFDLLRAPFDCTVQRVNSRLALEPGLASRDPFGEGWVAVLLSKGGPSKLAPLQEASNALANKIRLLGVRCFSKFPDLEMFEIGTECSAVIVKLNEAIDRAGSGTVVHLVSDDPTSDLEVARWEYTTKNKIVESLHEGSLHHFIIEKS